MKPTTFSFLAWPLCVALLSGCLVAEMEKITLETRDEVRKSRTVIEETRDGHQVATALELCLDPHVSEAARVGACKSPLLRLPEDRLADYLGIPLRVMEMGTIKRDLEHTELDLPNIMYIGAPEDRNHTLRLSATSEEFFQVLRMATRQLIVELGLKTRQAGLSAKNMAEYRDNARRLNYVAPAILGAVRLDGLNRRLAAHSALLDAGEIGPEQFSQRVLREVAAMERIVPESERQLAVEGLRDLGRNVSLTETELRAAEVMFELRLGIRL